MNADTGFTLELSVRAMIEEDAERLSEAIERNHLRNLAPGRDKQLRSFTSTEVAELLGMHPGHFRKLLADKKLPELGHGTVGKKLFSGEEILEIRRILAKTARNPLQILPNRQKDEKLQVVSCVTFKGGSAKTTSVAYLSQRFALLGYRVLVVDMDPQASLTTIMGLRPDLDLKGVGTVYDVLRYDSDRKNMKEVVRPTYFPNLWLAPASLILSEYESETPRALQEKVPEPFYARLLKAIHSVEDQFDLVFIDCPPQLGFLTLSAMTASTALLVPVIPNMIDVASLGQFMTMTSSAFQTIERFNGTLSYDFLRYLLCRHEPTDGPQTQVAAFLRSIFHDRVMTNAFLKSTAIADAGLTSDTIYEVERGSMNRATINRALESINLVAAELEEDLHRVWGRKA